MPLPQALTKSPMTLPYLHSVTNGLQSAVGEHGVPDAALAAMRQRLQIRAKALLAHPPAQLAAIFRCVEEGVDLSSITTLAEHWRRRFSSLVVIGCGGSGMSGKALCSLFGNPQVGKPALHTLDNLDTDTLSMLLPQIDLKETAFLVVSKGGETVETHTHFSLLVAALKDAGITDFSERVAVISTEQDNPLTTWAKAHQVNTLPHDKDLGGRFSIFSCVGLIPAATRGIDIKALVKGARHTLANTESAIEGAAWMACMQEQGKNIQVFFPYGSRLWGIALWWRQAFAESLGKDGKGCTPHVSLGTTDQHSQLQLYLDGPRDKAFTLLFPDTQGQGPRLGPNATLPKLQGKTVGDILDAQARATAETLKLNGCPARTFTLPTLNEETAGAVFMQLLLEVAFLAELMGVNAFDQPAVEESKQLTRDYLNHP